MDCSLCRGITLLNVASTSWRNLMDQDPIRPVVNKLVSKIGAVPTYLLIVICVATVAWLTQ